MIKLKFKSIKNSQLLQIQINQIFLITKITKKGYEKGHERYQNLSKEKRKKGKKSAMWARKIRKSKYRKKCRKNVVK